MYLTGLWHIRGRHDIRRNGIEHNDTKYTISDRALKYENQHSIMPNVPMKPITLSVAIKSTMLTAVMLNVAMLNVVAPIWHLFQMNSSSVGADVINLFVDIYAPAQ